LAKLGNIGNTLISLGKNKSKALDRYYFLKSCKTVVHVKGVCGPWYSNTG